MVLVKYTSFNVFVKWIIQLFSIEKMFTVKVGISENGDCMVNSGVFIDLVHTIDSTIYVHIYHVPTVMVHGLLAFSDDLHHLDVVNEWITS